MQAHDEINDTHDDDKSQSDSTQEERKCRAPIPSVPSLIITSHDSEHTFPNKKSEESRSETDIGDVSETDTSSLLYMAESTESADANLQLIRGDLFLGFISDTSSRYSVSYVPF